MTPLNSIISNASLIQNYLGDRRKKDLKQAIKPLISQIEQSSQIMYFHNRNQITKMQIQKGDFRSTQQVTKSPEDYTTFEEWSSLFLFLSVIGALMCMS